MKVAGWPLAASSLRTVDCARRRSPRCRSSRRCRLRHFPSAAAAAALAAAMPSSRAAVLNLRCDRSERAALPLPKMSLSLDARRSSIGLRRM